MSRRNLQQGKSAANEATETDLPGSQRIDKWLWHVRLVKTRTAAAALVSEGKVRVNGARVDKPGYAIKPGETLTVVLRSGVRILKVVGFAERRGDADAAALLMEDLTPPKPVVTPTGQASGSLQREAGSGRPTKRDRRLIDRLKGQN
jgi:ribosome-associated heat shock protein Hsp15